MSNVRVSHGIGDLAADQTRISKRVRPDMTKVVRSSLLAARNIARSNARRTAGQHGKHYPKAITAEMHEGLGLFGNTISGEYGPDPALPQGGMSFEGGSRNQPPHLDLAKSADVTGPEFARKVSEKVEDWSW